MPRAPEIARQRGIDIRFVEEEGQSPIGHPNTAILDMSDGEKKAQLSGCSIGGGAIEVREIVLHGINIKPAGSLPIVILVDFERKLNHERSLSDFLKLKAPFKEKESTSRTLVTSMSTISKITSNQP